MRIIKIGALWCPGCLIVNKALKEISKEYDVDIIHYDYDMDIEVEKYNVGEVLPVLIFETDKEVKRLIGERSKREIIEVLEEVLNEK